MTEVKTELQKNAIADARRKELETFQRALDIQWLNNRMEDGRMGRCLALIQKEAEMEKDYQERTDHAAIVNARAKRETQLGIEVAKIRREEACKLLRRHYLRERDPELRELSRKLQAGYVCRDLRQQILHNEYRRIQEKQEESYANKIMLDAVYNNKEAQELEEKQKFDRNTAYRLELQQQLVNKEMERQCAYEETLIEKKMLEEIMRTIADEDHRELEQKRMLRERCRNEMVTFKQARDAWKQKQKDMVIIEEKQIEEQKKAASDRSSAIIAERERKMRAKDELNERICAKIIADQAVQQERENIIKTLQEQEYLEKNVQDNMAEKSKLERSKRDTMQALTEQMENKKRLEKEQKKRELEFRITSEAKMAADNEKEVEKERKKHEKGLAYAKELKRQIEENARRREIEKKKEAARAQEVWDHYKGWDKEVSSERAQIVSEHAPHLIGHLQAGVIKRHDLPAVIEGANKHEHLKSLDLKSIAESSVPNRFPKCNAQCRILRDY